MDRESIAVIGMSCRFPGAKNLNEFWKVLTDGIDAITVPSDHHEGLTGYGGFLQHVDRFDAGFFGIPHQEAVTMDPQHKFLLEVTWEALEDAGQIPAQLTRSNTGVFIGISDNDYHDLVTRTQAVPRVDASTGNDVYMAANRISYHLDFTGPSQAINTACSSSLVAVHLACQSLAMRETSLAVAAGVHMFFSQRGTARFSNAGLIAPDGRCKSFDFEADGYVRGEGVGVVILKLLSQAKSDGDRIYAVIRGSAVNQNGRGSGFTVPNLPAQVELLRRVYQQSGVDPKTIHFIEGHGTATLIGDAVEIESLGAVIGKGRPRENPCRVGSVKPNIGHTESAAGIASLIKTVLSLHYRKIPASLHFRQTIPFLSLEKLGLRVQQQLESIPADVSPMRAGVSAFGLGGTNAHVIVEEVPKEAPEEASCSTSPLHVLTLTAKSENALHELANRYQGFLRQQSEASLVDVCATANTRRTQFNHRLAVITESKEQLINQLNAYIRQESLASVFCGEVVQRKPLPICFVFSRESSKLKDIIRSYYESQPNLRSCLAECDTILSSHLGKHLIEVIDEDHFDNPHHAQLAIFLTHYALAQLWKSWGIEPAIAMGFGIGAYAALTIAGILSMDDAIALVLGEKSSSSLSSFQPAKLSVISATTGAKISVTESISPSQWQQDFDFDASDLTEFPNPLSDSEYALFDPGCGRITHSSLEGIPRCDHNGESLYSVFTILVRLWLTGVKVDWSRTGDYKHCFPISLPTYPFEQQSYWISTTSEIENNEYVSDDGERISERSDVDFVNPGTVIEQQLAYIWQQTLGLERISIHDNFFDLGGTSRLALVLVAEIDKAFDLQFSLASFLQFPTIAEMAQSIVQSKLESPTVDSCHHTSLRPDDYRKILTSVLGRPGLRPNPHSLMVCLASKESQLPIFLCANALSEAAPLSRYIGEKNTVYLLESGFTVFWAEDRVTEENLKAIASHHVHDILSIQPEGDYQLAGYSFGGLVAYEIAKQLEERGKKVAMLTIIDTRGHNDFVYKCFQKLANLASGISELCSNSISKIRGNDTLKTPAAISVHSNYRMQGYRGKVTLFLATEPTRLSSAAKVSFWLRHRLFPRFGWTKESVYQVHLVPGTHRTMIQEPHVRSLANSWLMNSESSNRVPK